MSAKDLIILANSKGIGVSREHSKRYRWARVEGGKLVETYFLGTWPEFVKLVKGLPSYRAEKGGA